MLKIRKKGFTLAEMLMVLLIISCVALALVPYSVKRFKVYKESQNHGRYVCYYSGNNLIEKEYHGTSSAPINNYITANGTQCTHFKPSEKASYFIVQLVGGGGGGGYAASPSGAYPGDGKEGYVYIQNGYQISTSITAPWVADYLNSTTVNVKVMAQSGGGGGGAGNQDIPIISTRDQPPCLSPYIMNNNLYCRWTYSTAYKGGSGGSGKKVEFFTPVKIGKTIYVSPYDSYTNTGAGGETGSVDGKNGSEIRVSIDGTTVVILSSAGKGTGAIAPVYDTTTGSLIKVGSDGVDGKDSACNSTPLSICSDSVLGGVGGAGGVGYICGTATCSTTNNGGGVTPSVVMQKGVGGTLNSDYYNFTPKNISFRFDTMYKTLGYGEGGKKGYIKDAFFSKLPENLVIIAGKGGQGGTPANKDGSSGGETKIYVPDAAAYAYNALGGAGGLGNKSTDPVDFYYTWSEPYYKQYVYDHNNSLISGVGYDSSYSKIFILSDWASVRGGVSVLGNIYDASDSRNTDLVNLGSGGDGGTSSSYMGYVLKRTFNGNAVDENITVGSPDMVDSANDLIGDPASGTSGGVIITW